MNKFNYNSRKIMIKLSIIKWNYVINSLMLDKLMLNYVKPVKN